MKTKCETGRLSTGLVCFLLFSASVRAESLLNWTARNIGKGTNLNGVCCGGGRYVAIGSAGFNGVMLQSQDGATWASVTSFTDKSPQCIASGNDAFLCAFTYGEMWRSTDGLAWTNVSHPDTPGIVRFVDGEFFAIAGSEHVLRSTDGLSWSTLNSQHTGVACRDIAVNSNIYVMVGQKNDGKIFITRTADAGATWSEVDTAVTNHLRSVAHGGNTFVAVGGLGSQSGLIMTSPDGRDWSVITRTNSVILYKVIYESGLFVAAGDAGTILCSADGAEWTTQNSGSGYPLRDVCFANDAFLAVGSRGVVIQSGARQGGGSTPCVPNDFSGDGKTQLAVYEEASGTWYVQYDDVSSVQFGAPGCVPVSGDYDGDGMSEVAVYKEETGYWHMLLSGGGYDTLESLQFGGPGCRPVSGDFDGDRKTDVTVYDGETGLWWALLSGSGYALDFVPFGGPGYDPVSCDFDGDGKTDIAVYDEDAGRWWALLSGSGYALDFVPFGGPGYRPVSGDYDGDGKTDIVVYEETTGYWWLLLSNGNYDLSQETSGGPGYTPVPGDYDGDGISDIAVYHQESGSWRILLSGNDSNLSSQQLGGPGCAPVM